MKTKLREHKLTNHVSHKICSIVCKEIKSHSRIQEALVELKPQHCQFNLPAEYEHAGEYFCLLHLPFNVKKDKRLMQESNEKIIELINEGCKNFNFITATGLEIHNISFANTLSFIGSDIWSLKFTKLKLNAHADCIDFSYSKINGISQISECEAYGIILIKSEISSQLIFKNITAKYINICGNHFKFNDSQEVRLDNKNYGLTFSDVTADLINFLNNECYLALEFQSCKINELYIKANTFYQCPIICESDLTYTRILTLPDEKDFNLSRFSKKAHDSWSEQHKKFREIYNLARKRNMYAEQGDYFSLMQLCMRKTGELSSPLQFSSWLYGFFSNYGQSISRPAIGLFLCSLLAFAGYSYILNDKQLDVMLLTAKQITSPYSLVSDNQILEKFSKEILFYKSCTLISDQFKCKKYYLETIKPSIYLNHKKMKWLPWIGIFQSTFSLIFLALLLLALRWHFRKA